MLPDGFDKAVAVLIVLKIIFGRFFYVVVLYDHGYALWHFNVLDNAAFHGGSDDFQFVFQASFHVGV